MSNLFSEYKESFLKPDTYKYFGEEVQYTRGGETIAIQAKPRSPGVEYFRNDYGLTIAGEQDFQIAAKDLIFGGEYTEPKFEDKIVWNGDTFEILTGQPFEIVGTGGRKGDVDGVDYRIPTQKNTNAVKPA